VATQVDGTQESNRNGTTLGGAQRGFLNQERRAPSRWDLRRGDETRGNVSGEASPGPGTWPVRPLQWNATANMSPAGMGARGG
jgi:hypothetical protein